MKRVFVIVVVILLVLFPVLANIKEKSLLDTDIKECTQPTKMVTNSTRSDENTIIISSDAYYSLVENVCETEIESAGFVQYRTTFFHPPYYECFFEIDDVSQEDFYNTVKQISRNVYNDLLKFDYKSPSAFKTSNNIIDITFRSKISDEQYLYCVQIDISSIDRDKSYEENVTIFM